MWLRNFYAFAEIDRAGHRRRDQLWLEARLVHPNARFVPIWRTQNLVTGGSEALRAAILAPHQLAHQAGQIVLLGVAGEDPVFAVDLSEHEDPLAAIRHPDPLEFTDLRRIGSLIDRAEASLLAYARGMVWWHSRHRFCGVCGSPTESAEAGHVRRCTDPACGAAHFPRTDPAVIMLVT